MNYVADKTKVYTRVVYLCLPRVQDGFDFFSSEDHVLLFKFRKIFKVLEHPRGLKRSKVVQGGLEHLNRFEIRLKQG